MTSLKKSNVRVLKGKNTVIIVLDPINAPRNIFFKDAFLFSVLFTVKRRRKSKNKFNRNKRSKYIVISSPLLLYRIMLVNICRFICFYYF